MPDYDDRCPDTPRGVAVTPDGCPLDTDGDGVPDYLDKCPETGKGVKVDAQGCQVVEAASNVVDIYFDLGRALVKREFFSRLDSLARDLAASGENVNVIGFTDQKGTVSYNQELSDRRAQAVRDYLVSRGVKAAQIKIAGKGKFPLEKTAGAPSSAEQRTATIRMREQ
ncbi:OmpA family protein [bacterium]|nr:OmpA family protein [bacterium]